ncbi:hypothetical protein Tco_1461914, partial [Tanacetum coccineum]
MLRVHHTKLLELASIHKVLSLNERAEGLDTLEDPTVKYSLYKGLNSKSNSCNNGASVSGRGETLGTSFELEVISSFEPFGGFTVNLGCARGEYLSSKNPPKTNSWYRISTKGQKQSQKLQNRARKGKSVKKSKSK